MTKKTFSKVIAMACVAALCLTAVFTGVVSAEARTATYTVIGRGYEQGAKDSFVAADVTFESGTAFVAGSFKVAASGLSLVDCTSSAQEAKCYLNVSNNKVLFAGFTESATNDITSFSSLTLTLLFTVNDGKLEDKGTDWAVAVTLSDIDLTNEAEETYTCSASGTPAVAIHVHNYALASTANNVNTYSCSVCGATKTEVVAESSAGTNDLADSKSTAARFTKDGDIELLALAEDSACNAYDSVYFSYSYKTDDGEAHEIATAEAALYNGYRVFACKGNRGIGRMGRVVTGNFIGVKDGNVTTSDVWEYSVKAYAESLFNNADADIAGYAKSLWNYGKYTAEAINGYDHQQGFFADAAQAVSPEWTTADGTAPTYTDSDDSWKIKKAQVTTGYKPTMKLTFSNAAGTAAPTCDSIVIKVTHSDKIVYHKEIAVANMQSDGSYKYFEISDIPTKYLTDDITVTAKTGDAESAKIGTYGFGRYTKSRIDKNDASQNVFKWMMTFAMYLGQEYA